MTLDNLIETAEKNPLLDAVKNPSHVCRNLIPTILSDRPTLRPIGPTTLLYLLKTIAITYPRSFTGIVVPLTVIKQ